MSFEEYGSNSGFFEDMHRRYLENPQAVDASWRAFFEGEEAPPSPPPAATEPAAAPPEPAAAAPEPPAPPPEPEREPEQEGEQEKEEARPPLLLEGEEPSPLRGASARIVEN